MHSTEHFLSKQEVMKRTSLSYSSLWRQIKAGTFPAGIKIGPNRIAWRMSDLESWMASKIKGD